MALIEDALVEWLKRSADVAEVLGQPPDGALRVYPGEADPAARFPRVVYTLQDESRAKTLSGGASGSRMAAFSLEMQTAAGASNYRALRALAELLVRSQGGNDSGRALESFGPGWFPYSSFVNRLWVQEVRATIAESDVEQVGGQHKSVRKLVLSLVFFYQAV